jgi:hypothetical protein
LALALVAFVPSESEASAAQTAGSNPPPTLSIGQGTLLTPVAPPVPPPAVTPRSFFTLRKGAPPWVDDAPHPPPHRNWPFAADPRRWPRLFANTTECTLSFDPVLRRHRWQP